MKALVLHSIVPVRAEADEGAEQLTQLLFGETCDILEEKPRWIRICADLDKQIGWVDFKMIRPISSREWNILKKQDSNAIVLGPYTAACECGTGKVFPLTSGSRLWNYANGSFEILGVKYTINSDSVLPKPLEWNEDLVKKAISLFMNIPYLWAGKNALGMDCSGFTQVFHSLFGHNLLRNAREQITQGVHVSSLDDAKAGDLVFFDHNDTVQDEHSDANNSKADTRITHVGIIYDAQTVVHCSGRVKMEHIDQRGILSSEQVPGKIIYTHHLVDIRRYN